MNFSERIFAALSAEGLNYCTSVPGGGVMYLVDAVGRNEKFQTRFFHHEQSAGIAAESYARASGGVGCCLVTIGPGVANAVAAAFSCFINSVPVIFISGAKRSNVETNYAEQRFNYPQDANTEELVKSVVKIFVEIKLNDDVDKIVRNLVHVSKTGRPGPVWISVPLDIQATDYSSETFEILIENKPQNVNSENIFIEIKRILDSAEYPIICIGRGVESVKGREDYKNFLANSNLPFVTTIGSNHLITCAKNLDLGFFGPTGRRAANHILDKADAIIAIGSGLDVDTTGFDRKGFFNNKRVLVLNSDPYYSIKEDAMDSTVLNVDATEFDYDKYTELFQKYNSKFANWSSYAESVNDYLSVEKEIALNLTHNKIDPYLFCLELTKLLPGKVGIAGGISLEVHAFSHVAKLKEGQEFYLSPHCGQLGWDLPALVGLADSSRFESVICLTGDGSIMFNLQELATISKLDINVSIIIFDNEGYNSIRSSQDAHLQGRRYGSDLDSLAFPDWSKLGSAFGFNYISLENNNEISRIQRYINDGKNLIRVMVDKERGRTPKLVSKISNGKFISPRLSEQFPYLSDDDMDHLLTLAKSNKI